MTNDDVLLADKKNRKRRSNMGVVTFSMLCNPLMCNQGSAPEEFDIGVQIDMAEAADELGMPSVAVADAASGGKTLGLSLRLKTLFRSTAEQEQPTA